MKNRKVDLKEYNWPFLKRYSVYSEENGFSIREKKTGEVKATYDMIEEIDKNIYALEVVNSPTIRILVYNEETKELYCSEDISSIIKVFKGFVLIECVDGKKELRGIGGLYKCHERFNLQYIKGERPFINHVIAELPNGKFTILTEDLRVADIEFDDTADHHIVGHNKYRIVKFKDDNENSYAVVRISDLKVSQRFDTIKNYKYFRYVSDRYLFVYADKESNPAIMRLEDFKVSKEYFSIRPISEQYALVSDFCYVDERILRLKDFRISKWENE